MAICTKAYVYSRATYLRCALRVWYFMVIHVSQGMTIYTISAEHQREAHVITIVCLSCYLSRDLDVYAAQVQRKPYQHEDGSCNGRGRCKNV